MKRVVKSFFIFLLLFAVVNVNALNVGDKFSISIKKESSHSAKYEMGGFGYQLESATGGGKTYDAYCIDRSKDYSGERSVYRMLNEFKGDYAALYIMKNGADDEEIHLAIRALVSEGIWNYGYKSPNAAAYLAILNAKVNCMKSDPEFSSVLTEFLSTSSKKNENSDEGGKSIALLGFDKYNLLESKCTYDNAADCSENSGGNVICKKNGKCYISTGKACTEEESQYYGFYIDSKTGKYARNSKNGCKLTKQREYETIAECADAFGNQCYCTPSTGKCYQYFNNRKCDNCNNKDLGYVCSNERDQYGCKKSIYACSDTQDSLQYKDCSYKVTIKNGSLYEEDKGYWICEKNPSGLCYSLKRTSNCSPFKGSELQTCCYRNGVYYNEEYFATKSDCEEEKNSDSKVCVVSNGCYRIVDKKPNQSCDGSKGEYDIDTCLKRKKGDQECKELDNGCYKIIDKNAKCDTGAKQNESFENCLIEKGKKEKESNNTKKYKCEQDSSTKCFNVVEDNSGSTGDGDGSGGNGSGGSGPGSGASTSCGGWDNIKKLLIDAMKYANEKFNSETGESKVEKGPATDPEKADDGKIKKIVSVKVDIQNITDPSSDEEYFKYLGFEAEKATDAIKVELLGTSTEFLQTEEGWESLSEGEDLSDRLGDEKNGTLYVGFLVWRNSSEDSEEVTDDSEEEEDCDVKIKFKYEQSNADGGAELQGYATNAQRFFIATEGEPIQDEFELDTSLCDETTCDPTSTLPNICEDGLEPDKETGNVEYEFREAYNEESGKYNIKKCLLSKNSKDKANNSYKLIDNEYADMVAENDYCEVKCKEDYIFGVPYKKNTESGRYFQISVSLKGDQDCYTTKLDYKKYTEDIVKKQKEIVETYNVWLENYENYTFTLVEGDAVDCNAVSCPSITNSTECNTKGMEGKDHKKKIKHSKNFYTAEIEEGEDKWTITVEIGATVKDPQFGEWSDDTKCENCSVTGTCDWEEGKTPDKDYADKKDSFKEKAQAAKDKLKQLLEDLRTIIDTFNSCAADHEYPNKQNELDPIPSPVRGKSYWDMIYKYNPDILYSYEEPEPGISSTRWISSVQALPSCEHGMRCDYMYSTDALVTAEKCADTTGGKVNCNESTSIKDIDDDEHVSTWYCDGDIDNEYEVCKGNNSLDYQEETQWTVLDEDLDTDIDGIVHIGNNLKNSTHIITTVDYVHKIASSEGTYKTERVYYTGHDDGDIEIEKTPEHEKENYDIVDGLPVGINTPTGIYYYKLALKNFGTFYTPSNAPQINGRIYDELNNSLSTVIRGTATSKNDDQIGTNEYACTYEVNQNVCVDSAGNKHYKSECKENEDWDKCQERICGATSGGPYCVEKAEQYYKCSNTYYDESCEKVGSGTREETLLAVGCQPGEVCEHNYSCCPNCTTVCVGICTIIPPGGGENKPNYDFRPVSPGNLFPNDREVGFNWERDESVYKNSLVARKAGDTIDEITTRAKTTTTEETPSTSGTPKVGDYSLKVVMNSDMITNIRKYNKSQESYNNDTMTCYDYPIERDEDGCKKAGYTWKKEGTSGKCVMANIFCYSSFVDELVKGDFGGEVDIKNGEERIKAKENFNATNYTAPGVSNTDNLIVTNDYWTIYTFSSLDVNNDGIPDVGPSWK